MSVGGLALALAWIGGTVLALHASVPPWPALVVGLASLGLAAAGRGGPTRLGALALGAATLAVARVGFDATSPVLFDLSGPVVLVGRVGDVPSPLGGRQAFPLDVTALGRPGEPPASVDQERTPRVLVRAARADLTIGDLVAVEGRLVRPRSRPGWPEEQLLARRGIGTIADATRVTVREPAGPGLRASLERLRKQLYGTIRAALPEPHASLAAGVALGSRGGLTPELRESLAVTGTGHIVAASGYNVAVVGGVALAVAGRLVGRPWALAPTIIALWAYAILVGAGPSVIRAALMASLAIGAWAVGRLSDAVTALSLAAALMVAWDPWLVYDLGFQLSAVATAGLVLFATPIAERLRPLPGTIRDAVGATLAAELTTLPIVLGTFHTLSLVAPLANAAVVPVVPALTIVGGALSVLGDLPGPGTGLAWAAWGISAYVLAVIDWCARLPAASVATGQLPPWVALGWYAALAIVALTRSPELTTRLGPLRPVRVGAAAGAVCLAMAPVLAVQPSEVATVSLLDVGAPAAFVRAPGGRTLVAAAGATPAQLRASLAERLALWERGVDVAVALGTSERTRAALDETLARYPASMQVVPVAGGPADGEASFGELVAAHPGMRIELGPGVWLEVVDVRSDEGRAVADAVIGTDAVAIWLPGPGAPSERWSEVSADVPTIVRLPGRSSGWVGKVRPGRLIAVISDGLELGDESALGDVRRLDHKTHGAVEIVVEPDGAALAVERCAGEAGCRVGRLLGEG